MDVFSAWEDVLLYHEATMWTDYGYLGLAIIVTDFLHQLLWLGCNFLFAVLTRNIGWSIVPNILASFLATNILWATFPWWKVSGAPAVYGAVIFIVLLNLQSFFRVLKEQRGNPQRLQIFWWIGTNIGFALFGLQRLIVSLVS